MSAFLSASTLWAAATLQPLKGIVTLQTSETAEWTEVSSSLSIEEGARIKTGPGASAFLTTADDHRIAIGPDTYATLQRLAPGETKLFLKQGSVRNKVRPLRVEAGQYFKIQTPTAVVAVRGTDFSVLQSQIAQVRVFEGAVDLGALRAELQKEPLHLTPGQSATIDAHGHTEEQAAAPDKGPRGPKGPPPPPPPGGQGGVTPPAGIGNTPPEGAHWWDHPEHVEGTPDFFGGPPPTDPGSPIGAPKEPGSGPNPGKPPPGNGPPNAFNPFPFGDPSGNGGTGVNPPSIPGQPPIPPTGTGGSGTGGGGGTQVGTDALIDTLRSKNLHAQADALLIADLYQRRAIATDPLTGQLRQYADAVLSAGPDGIKFINATMMAGVPNSLNYTASLVRFNQALPASYWNATQTAFAAGANLPSWYAIAYQTDISNTADHLIVNASGGAPMLDTLANRYITRFNDIQTSINGTVLWSKSGANTTYLGGSMPTTSVVSTTHADNEVQNTYSNGTFVAVRNVFADDQGHVASMASKPSGMGAADYLNSLNARTLIRSNLLTRGSLDIFGTAKGRTLSGLFTYDDAEASAILNGAKSPLGAPIGLLPN